MHGQQSGEAEVESIADSEIDNQPLSLPLVYHEQVPNLLRWGWLKFWGIGHGPSKYAVMQREEGRHETERTWKPTAAGILCIIAGIIGLIPAMAVAVLFVGASSMFGGIPSIIFAPLIPLILFGILPIVGGICAVRRRRWGLALAGSICCPLVGFVILGFYFLFVLIGSIAIWPRTPEFGDPIPLLIGFIVGFAIFGILPIVFIILGKREFK